MTQQEAVEHADAEAAVWLARLHAGDRSKEEEQAFRDWLAASPYNEAAFDHITAVWDVAGAAERAPYQSNEDRAPSSLGRRRVMLGGGVALLGAVGLGGWQAAVAGVYRTSVGEQKRIVLPDSSTLFLDTDSKLRVRYSESRRLVELMRGQCNFSVMPDRLRSFVVVARQQQVVSTGGDFDVRTDTDRLQVVCLHGTVDFTDNSGGGVASLERIASGRRLLLAAGRAPRMDAPDVRALTSWQTGQLIFDDETLGEAIGEMNRYSPAKLVADSDRVRSLRLSGVYRVGDSLDFARSAAQLLGLRVAVSGNEISISAG